MDSNPQIIRNIISNNKANGSTSGLGGGIILYTNCSPLLKNNIITKNESLWGAGIFLHLDSNPVFENNTISNNNAYYNGGGIYSRYHSNPFVINSIFWNNLPQEIYCDDNNGVDSVTIRYSNIKEGLSGIINGQVNWLDGNINTDPMFIDTINNDYHFQINSPCIDTGDSSANYNDVCFPPSMGTERNDIGAFGGPWACELSDSVVPVELTSFASSLLNGDVKLEWSTATETNDMGFEIQKRNGNNEYQKIGFVPGHGTTTESYKYSYTDSKIASDNYYYRLKQIDLDGTFQYSNEVSVNISIPLEFALKQNYPNPFNPTTKINYQIPKASFVTLRVYDVLGKEVATLVNEEKSAGSYEFQFDGSELSSGIYFYKLNAGSFTQINKMTMIK